MFSLGQLQLTSNLFLSPLAGYTNLPFRLVIREIGGVDLCTTDLVNARSLIEQNPKALKLIETNDQDSPLSVQLFGGVKEEMRDASIYSEGAWSRLHRCQHGLPRPQGHQDRGGCQHDE
jgi:tRNA-dihydrouridine synthase